MTLIWIIAIFFAGILVVGSITRLIHDNAYRKAGLLPAAGRATMADVQRLILSGHRVLAIRCYREIHRVGLAEAKTAVEKMAAELARSDRPINPD